MIPSNLLPEGTQYFIAGGWAACPALAQDRDLFVQTTDNLTDTRQRLLNHMRAEGFDVQEEEETRDFVMSDGYSVMPIAKVAKVKIRFAQDVHVLVTNGDPEEVLSTFDLTTSQVAITHRGTVVKGPDYAPITTMPQKVKDTPTTDARLLKYRQRFGFDAE